MLLLCLVAHGKGYTFIDTFYRFATVSTGLSSDRHEKRSVADESHAVINIARTAMQSY